MKPKFSVVIPVYNRNEELQELLSSLVSQSGEVPVEVIVVDDGSSKKADQVAQRFSDSLNVHYYYKENTGAGPSRNYGMQKATGDYFLIFDSDCILPQHYLETVSDTLEQQYTDAFGGPDAAHESFTPIQKAINYSMTSFATTGGLRTGKSNAKFQPRSFNMGMSRDAFESTGGFSEMKIGEDIDLTFRLWQHGMTTQCIERAYVYHKRRTSFEQFYTQTFKFGQARPRLTEKYPGSGKLSYWFPTVFILMFVVSLLLLLFGQGGFLVVYVLYFALIFSDSLYKNKSIPVAALSIVSTVIQFTGYGIGFLKGQFGRD